MSDYADMVTNTPQSENARADQVENNAGGFVFKIDKWARLNRFLILGSDGSTYYQSAGELTRENAKCVQECWDEDPERTAVHIREISWDGRAAKNDPAIFAMALGFCHSDVKVRQHAYKCVSDVCRIPTHLFMFVKFCRKLGRGWGPMMKRVVAEWYDSQDVGRLAMFAVKYRAREGYDHSRLIKCARPAGDKTDGETERDATYRWMIGKDVKVNKLPEIIQGHVEAMACPAESGNTKKAIRQLVEKHRLPWEAIPTEATKDPKIWQSMLPNMGLTALIRNLGKMTAYEAIKPLSDDLDVVMERLGSEEAIRKARVHPFTVLQALAAYRGGTSIMAQYGGRQGLHWTPIPAVIDALDSAFYKAFENVEPAGKRTLIGLDVSGSMTANLNNSFLTAREAAAAMAMVTMRTEPKWHVMAFTAGRGGYSWNRTQKQSLDGFIEVDLKASDSLASVLKKTSRLSFGMTDCALPMLYALEKDLKVDTFIVLTDNETWTGSIHPSEALQKYRKHSGIDAKLVVVGMTSTGFSIADPKDPGMLDVVGFDSAAPRLIGEFSAGSL